MRSPASKEPRLVQVLAWRAGRYGQLERCSEWREERFLELDRLIAAERQHPARPKAEPRTCPVEGCARPYGSRRGGYCWFHRSVGKEGTSE